MIDIDLDLTSPAKQLMVSEIDEESDSPVLLERNASVDLRQLQSGPGRVFRNVLTERVIETEEEAHMRKSKMYYDALMSLTQDDIPFTVIQSFRRIDSETKENEEI